MTAGLQFEVGFTKREILQACVFCDGQVQAVGWSNELAGMFADVQGRYLDAVFAGTLDSQAGSVVCCHCYDRTTRPTYGGA